jgi:hypothetical protein
MVDAAVSASVRAGGPALRAALLFRFAQAALLLGAGWGGGAGSPLEASAAAGLGLAAVGVGAFGPAAVLAATERARPLRWGASAGLALIRTGVLFGIAALPAGLFALSLALRGDAQVIAALVALGLLPAVVAAGIAVAARLGPAPLLAARGGAGRGDIGRLLRRRVSLVPQGVLLALEGLAAIVATTTLGVLAPGEVLEASWSALLALELEAAALWRLLGAPVLVLSVFVHAGELGEG